MPHCNSATGFFNNNFVSRFIYTDDVDSEDLTVDLLAASDKYNLKGLFNKCQLELSHNIDIDNAADCYLAAYLHEEAALLKETSLRFIIDHYKVVKITPGFAKICLLPKALVEILDEAVLKP